MKLNWLIILIVFLSATAFDFNQRYSGNNLSIRIDSKDVIKSAQGKVYVYTISIYSPERLQNFRIEPSVMGENSDSRTSFEFSSVVRKAQVTYYYAVPDSISNKEVKILFLLSDANSQISFEDLVKM